MSKLCGRKGKIMLGSSEITGMREWSLSWKSETIDVTSFAATAPTTRERLACLTDVSGTFSGNHTDAWIAGLSIGGSGLLKLYVNSTIYYSGSAIISSIDPTITVDGEAGVSFSFESAGSWSVSGV